MLVEYVILLMTLMNSTLVGTHSDALVILNPYLFSGGSSPF